MSRTHANQKTCGHVHNASQREVIKNLFLGAVGIWVVPHRHWGKYFGGCGHFEQHTPVSTDLRRKVSIMEAFLAFDSDTSYEWEDDEAPFAMTHSPVCLSGPGSISSSSGDDNDVELSSDLVVSSGVM